MRVRSARFGLGLIIAGLLMAFLSGSMKFALLVSIVFWTGVGCVIVGLILLLAPVIVYLSNQLHQMLGMG